MRRFQKRSFSISNHFLKGSRCSTIFSTDGSSGSVYQSSSFEENRHRLDQSQGFRSSEPSERWGQEVTGCKRRNPSSRSEGPQRKRNKISDREINKRKLPSLATSNWPLPPKRRESKEPLQQGRTEPYHLRPRNRVTKEASSRPSRGEVQVQGGPVWFRGELFKRPSPYNHSRHSRQESKYQGQQQSQQNQKNGRSSHHSTGQSRHFRQPDRQETNGSSTNRRTALLEVLIGDVKDRRKEH
ncbi:hypothetical protein TNCV_612701 [Trichonephila clavipes]|nr:hypothetical protein TNCV_612701 [Trichonephila clavipes]